jgi:enoyl-CoA hydratase/carnithine racemase
MTELLVEHIHTRTDRGIGYITIDRRERFNSLDVRTAQDLRRAGLAMARDVNVKVVVLSGANGIFCSGADLKYIRAGGEADDLGYLSPDARVTPAGFGERFKQILEYLHSTIAEIRRALELGLINSVCAVESFDQDVRRVADTVASGPPAAFAVAKGLLNQAAGMDRIDVHLDRELENLARIADGAEFNEGVDSFFAKRPPRFDRV